MISYRTYELAKAAIVKAEAIIAAFNSQPSYKQFKNYYSNTELPTVIEIDAVAFAKSTKDVSAVMAQFELDYDCRAHLTINHRKRWYKKVLRRTKLANGYKELDNGTLMHYSMTDVTQTQENVRMHLTLRKQQAECTY